MLSQEILKIRDGTPLEILFFKIRPSQEILKIRDGTPFEKRMARILFFKIRPSQEILKIRDRTPTEAEEILPYIKSPRNGSICYFSIKLDVPSNVVQKKRVARIHFFKIRPSQEILKIRDGTPLEAEEILTYIKKPSKRISLPSQEILKIRDGTPLEKKRMARILFFKIRPSQEILKIRDGPSEAEEILPYIKSPRNRSICYFSIKLDVPSNVVHKKRVAWIHFFKIRPSEEILKIRDGTPLEAEEILTYIKKPSKRIVARILFFKIRPSQEILKIRDGTTFEAEEILTYIKNPRNGSICYFSSKLDISSNVVHKKRVAQILFFKIRPSQEILKIRDGTAFEAEEILTYIKSPRNRSICYFSSKLDVSSNVVQKKRVARILFFKIRPSQEILKIRDGTPFEAEEISVRFVTILAKILKIRDGTTFEAEDILTYIKRPSKQIDVPSNVVQTKRVARILFFKIRPSQEILKIRDGTPLEAEEILTYIKNPRNGSICYFSSKLDVPSNVVQKKRVARILFFKIRPSQKILKIRDGTPFEVEEILTYIKSPRNGSVCYFSSKLDVPSNVVQNKRVARILFFKIRPSQEILKIRDPFEAEEILTYIKNPSKQIVAWTLFFKIRPSQEILKIRDGTPLEAEEILTYIKNPRNGSICYFSTKLDVPSNVVQKKRVARILFFKIRPSQEILKICDGTPFEEEEILTYIKKPSKWIEILKIRDGTPLEIMAQILFFKIRPSQEILKIRDGTPFEAEEILTYIKKPSKWIEILKIRDGTPLELDVPSNVVQKKRVARILFFKIRPSQEILKIRDGTPFEVEEILTYIKSPRNGSVCYFSSKLDVPSNVVQNKRVARILFFKIRPSQEILKIRDPFEAEEILTYIKNPSKQIVARTLFFKIRPSQEILKIRDGTPLEAEEILTYIKNPRNGSICYFSTKLDVPSNVVQKKRVARILFFKIRPSQEILKICDGTPFEAEEILTYIKKPSKWIVAWILFFKIRPSQEILKIRDGTPLEAEEILTYIKKPSKQIEPSQEILKIRDGTPFEKRMARILFFKIRPSQEILKIRDRTPTEAEEILPYIKSPRNGSICYFSIKLDVPSNVVQKKRVARIHFFKIRPSQEILKIRDGTPLEAEEILTYIKKPSKRISLLLL
ncbi:hypothetical protein OROHE_011372 [Orobanche hederae]